MNLLAHNFDYAIPTRSLARWAQERVGIENTADGAAVYSFSLSGSTCNNMGVPLEAVMTVVVRDRKIERASAAPAANDRGCNAMCGAAGDGRRFLSESASCHEAIGLTLEQAAFRDWNVEPSGCFCTPGNRRHKWRNVFQTLHYLATTTST
jgi:hypothetical protein